MQPKQITTKPTSETAVIQEIPVQAQAGRAMIEVEQRIAYLEAIQDFQLMAKKRSRPFWKKMLSIK